MTQEARAWVSKQDECVRHRAWFQTPPEVHEFRQTLQAITDTAQCFLPIQEDNGRLYAFTDGTGKNPNLAAVRLVAWAWVAADRVGEDQFRTVGRGGVPGLWQTVLRAETCAVVSVLQYAVQHHREVTIFSDSKTVVKRLHKHLRGEEVTSLQTDHDLWEVIVALLRQMPVDVQCIHVHSHQQPSGLTACEDWVCRGNAAADHAAELAYDFLPAEVRSSQTAAAVAYQRNKASFEEVIKHFIRVGQQSIKQPSQVTNTRKKPPEAPVLREQVELHPAQIVECIRTQVPQYMQVSELSEWMSWFASLETPDTEVRLVSWIELLFHYQVTTGNVGVVCNKGKSGNQRSWVSCTLQSDVSTAKLATSFSQFGWNMLRLWDPGWKAIRAKPSSHRVQYWTSCVPLRVSDNFDQVVHRHFQACNISTIASVKALAKMAVATTR